MEKDYRTIVRYARKRDMDTTFRHADMKKIVDNYDKKLEFEDRKYNIITSMIVSEINKYKGLTYEQIVSIVESAVEKAMQTRHFSSKYRRDEIPNIINAALRKINKNRKPEEVDYGDL